jgi:hypothetical protein
MSRTSFNFGKRKLTQSIIEPTFFGNVADTIPTKTALENALGLTSSDITTFEIVGNDINATIITPYTLPKFWNVTIWQGITKFLDNSKMVVNVVYQGQRTLPSFNEIYLPEVTTIGQFYLRSNVSLTTVRLPKLTTITGGSVFVYDSALKVLDFPELISLTGTNHFQSTALNTLKIPKCTELATGAFANIPTNGQLTCNSFLATSNNGGEHSEIVYIRGRGWSVIYV